MSWEARAVQLKEPKIIQCRLSDADYAADLARQGDHLEAFERTYGLWQALRSHTPILVYVLASHTCSAAFGYDTIANGASLALPSFLSYYGTFDPARQIFYLDSIWTSLWTSMTGVGQIAGAFTTGLLSQKIGRRHAGMLSGSMAVVGVALQFFASSKGMLLAGKMVNGIAVGGLTSVGPTYASEILPPRLRGVLLDTLAFFSVSMQTIALAAIRFYATSTKSTAFRSVFAFQWIAGVLPILAFFLVPESPSHLVMKGQVDAARKSLIRLYGNKSQIEARLAYLQTTVNSELQESKGASYKHCFQGTDLTRTLTVCLMSFGVGLVGSAFLSQNIYFLVLTGLPLIHIFDINIGAFALSLLLMPLTWYISDTLGRRSLYLTGVIINTVVLGIVGGLGYAPLSNTGAVWAIAVLLNLLITWQSFTVIQLTWSLPPEISSYKLRQHTQSINIMLQAFSGWLFAFITPFMYNLGPHSGSLGAKTGLIYMGTSFVLLILAFFFIPETKGLSTEEIDYLYKNKITQRQFAGAYIPTAENKIIASSRR